LHGPSAQVTVLYSAPVMMGHADKRLYGHFTVSMTLYLFLAASQNDVDAACCYRLSSVVCVLICLSVSHDHKPCKTAEPVEMPFGLWTYMGPKNRVLHSGADSPIQRGNFEGERGGTL